MCFSLESGGNGCPERKNDIGLKSYQFFRKRSHTLDVVAGPTNVCAGLAAAAPTQLRELVIKQGKPISRPSVGLIERHENANAPYAIDLLCTSNTWPGCDSTA
jgi:hypothetical protein